MALQQIHCALDVIMLENLRLILSLRTREPRDSREDRDEDDADEEGPSVQSISHFNMMTLCAPYPFAILITGRGLELVSGVVACNMELP